MRPSLVIGLLLIVAGLFLALARIPLAGKTITVGEISLTERDEAGEQRLLLIGGLIGGVGLIVIVAGTPSSRSGQRRGNLGPGPHPQGPNVS